MKKVAVFLSTILLFAMIPLSASAKQFSSPTPNSTITPQANLVEVIDYARIVQKQNDQGIWVDWSAPEYFYKTINVVNGFDLDYTYITYSAPFHNNRPVALLFASSSGHEYSFHWVAGRGYYYDPAFDPTRYIIINNSWGSRDEISFDEYSSLLTSVTIK